jgi:serine/threonine protein kinase
VSDDATPSSRLADELIGRRYRIVSRLGIGGMGIVYKAIDIRLNRPVAVKAVEDRRLLLPGSAVRLRTEALAAASLDHPYICKVYELVETGAETFIVMEFVEGETLASMLQRGTIPLQRTLHIGREIAEGLAEAHAHGIVHRDVKPANVMITPSGHAKLLDFGVAAADVTGVPGGPTRTMTPQITVHAGTPQYMAPEQAAGHPVTARADVFSLGVVLYESLTGALPFSGATTFDYVRNMMQSAPKRLERIAPDTPADLVDLVERCLEKTPADRPDAREVVDALERLSARLSSPGVALPTARQARAGRRWKIVAAVAIAVAALAAGWRFVGPWTSPEAPLRQSRPFVTSPAAESGSRISPDSQWVSFIAVDGGASQVMVQRVDGGQPRPLTLGPGTPVSQTWSPDGSQLACVLRLNEGWVLQIYPAFFGGTSQHSIPLDASLQQIRLLRWVGRRLYFQIGARSGQSLRTLDLDAPPVLTDVTAGWDQPEQLRNFDVTPDGRRVAFVRRAGGRTNLWTANVDGSSARALTDDAFLDREPLWNGRGDRILFQSNRGGQIDLWEIDPRSHAAVQLTSGEMEEIAESTSADGSLISLQILSQDATLWRWGVDDPAGRQLTQDALSDYSPVAAGGLMAFQRSQPIPSQGYAIVDANLFVAPFDGTTIGGAAQSIGSGFAAAVSADGAWIGYLQGVSPAQVSTLQVRNLATGTTTVVSPTVSQPILSTAPVEWAGNTFTWSPSGAWLFFVDRPSPAGPQAIRRFDAATASAGPPLVTSHAPDAFLRDLYVAPDDRRLAYLASVPDTGVVLHLLDLDTAADRSLVAWKGSLTGVFGRGWVDDAFVVVRRTTLHEDLTADVDVLVVDAGSGRVRTAGTIPSSFIATTRLDASRRVLYVTRSERGVHNLYEVSLDTGALKSLTRNTLAGVTFSGFHPVGSGALLGTREERRKDLWLIQETGPARPGTPAGR